MTKFVDNPKRQELEVVVSQLYPALSVAIPFEENINFRLNSNSMRFALGSGDAILLLLASTVKLSSLNLRFTVFLGCFVLAILELEKRNNDVYSSDALVTRPRQPHRPQH